MYRRSVFIRFPFISIKSFVAHLSICPAVCPSIFIYNVSICLSICHTLVCHLSVCYWCYLSLCPTLFVRQTTKGILHLLGHGKLMSKKRNYWGSGKKLVLTSDCQSAGRKVESEASTGKIVMVYLSGRADL